MRAPARGPTARRLTPQLATLAILDVALLAARAALIAVHPDARPRGRHAAHSARPPLVRIAARMIARTAELRQLLTRYRRGLNAVHPDHDCRQAELPF